MRENWWCMGCLLIGTMLVVSLCGAEADKRTIHLKDGTTFLVPQHPNRICSVILFADEVLLNLIDCDRIVGLSVFVDDLEASNVFERAKQCSAQRVTANAEQVLALNPDLVLVASYTSPEFVHLIEQTGVAVYQFDDFSSLDSITQNILMLANLVDASASATGLVLNLATTLSQARALAQPTQPTVVSYWNGYVAGKNTSYDDIIRLAGGINIAAQEGVEGHAKLSPEKLFEWNPDFLVVGGGVLRFSDGQALVEQTPVLEDLPAVKQNRVIEIPNKHWSSVSQYAANAVVDLAQMLAQSQLLPSAQTIAGATQ